MQVLKFAQIKKLPQPEGPLKSKIAFQKSYQKGDIPAKIIKNSAYLSEQTILINNCLKKGVFPDDLKLADIIPIFKKEDRKLSTCQHTASFIESV